MKLLYATFLFSLFLHTAIIYYLHFTSSHQLDCGSISSFSFLQTLQQSPLCKNNRINLLMQDRIAITFNSNKKERLGF